MSNSDDNDSVEYVQGPPGYSGQLNEENQPHGFGKQRCRNGDVYEGNWQNGKPHGKGYYQYSSGAYYRGEFNQGIRHGKGEYAFANGQLYDGEWANGKRHGKGVFIANRNVPRDKSDYYEGSFVDGIQHGEGKLVLTNGDVFTGTYVNGKRKGKGILKLANGDKYQGMWQEDMPDGFGAYTCLEMKRHFVGFFKQGELVRQLCVPPKTQAKPDLPECDYPEGSTRCTRCGFPKQPCPLLRGKDATQQPQRPGTAQPKRPEAKPSDSSAARPQSAPTKAPTKSPEAVVAKPPQRKKSPKPEEPGVSGAVLAQAAEKVLASVTGGLGVAVCDFPTENNRNLVRVVEVAPNGPAAVIGLKRGDYLIKFNDKPIKNKRTLLAATQSVKPGQECPLAIISREGDARRTVAAKMGCNLSPSDYKFLTEVIQLKPDGVYPEQLLTNVKRITTLPHCVNYEGVVLGVVLK